MKTYRRIGLSLVLEFVAYTSLMAYYLVGGHAITLSYGLLVVAVLLKLRHRIRDNRNDDRFSHQKPTT